jgi:hypothetical protein
MGWVHLLRLFTLALWVTIFAGICLAQTDQTESVLLYNGPNATGMSQPIPVGSYQVSGKQLSSSDGKGAGISVKVPKGLVVKFCPSKDGSGNCEEYREGTHNLLSIDFNSITVQKARSQVVSSQVSDPAVTGTNPVLALIVFEQMHWGGRSQVFGPGMYRSFRGEFGKINDNQAMSVVVAKGFRARFCSDEGLSFRGSGDCEIHEEGRHNLRFANKISFIEVIDLSDKAPPDDKMPVVLYEDPSQDGKLQGFDVGTYLASKDQFRKLSNDQASSIVVKDGYRATVCADEPAGDGEGANCEEFTSGKKNLKNRKAASYLRVVKAAN